MIKKIDLHCGYTNPLITDIAPLARAVGKMKSLEWFDLKIYQYCDQNHLKDISELGRQLQGLPDIKYLHLYL